MVRLLLQAQPFGNGYRMFDGEPSAQVETTDNTLEGQGRLSVVGLRDGAVAVPADRTLIELLAWQQE